MDYRSPAFRFGLQRCQTAVTLNGSHRSSTCRALSFAARSLCYPLRWKIAFAKPLFISRDAYRFPLQRGLASWIARAQALVAVYLADALMLLLSPSALSAKPIGSATTSVLDRSQTIWSVKPQGRSCGCERACASRCPPAASTALPGSPLAAGVRLGPHQAAALQPLGQLHQVKSRPPIKQAHALRGDGSPSARSKHPELGLLAAAWHPASGRVARPRRRLANSLIRRPRWAEKFARARGSAADRDADPTRHKLRQC